MHAQDPALFGHGQILHRLVEGQLIGWDVIGDGRRLIVIGSLTVTQLHIRAVATDASDDRFAVVTHSERNGVDETSIDVGQPGRDLLLEPGFPVFAFAEVEARQPRLGFFGTAGDAVEIIFHASGELVVDEVREVTFHHIDDRERSERRNQSRALLPHIAAVLDGADDRCVRRWSPDLELLQSLDQRGLGET